MLGLNLSKKIQVRFRPVVTYFQCGNNEISCSKLCLQTSLLVSGWLRSYTLEGTDRTMTSARPHNTDLPSK